MTGSTSCAQVIVAELINGGVRDVVMCPGSRNAPLSYQVLEADRAGLLRLHVRIDERSAAFTALGIAKTSQHPVPVITTSGTATANLHPAVMEAAHSHIPLVAVTADRPASMIHTGANQTTQQRGLFAAHVQAETYLASADEDAASWRFQLGRVLSSCDGRRSIRPGPVHINVAFSEPLTPEPATRVETAGGEIGAAVAAAGPKLLTGSDHTVLVAGDTTPDHGAQVAVLAERAGIPLLAEPSSNARGSSAAISSYRIVLQSRLADEIERVIVLGHPTLSRPVTQLLRRDDIELIVVDGGAEWTDPTMNADRVVPAIEIGAGPVGDADWLRRWQQADRTLRPRIAELAARTGRLSGLALADRMWSQLTSDDVLFAGSSSPIRDLDLATHNPAPATCYANRGLAGIDGSISTAAGIALAGGGGVHALLGDLSFLHDCGGLIIGGAEPQPRLRIVIANDDGGSIFATLEHGEPAHADAYERIFGTATGADVSGFAAATGSRYHKITDADQLRQALREPISGTEILDVAVDRQQRRRLDTELAALAATL